VKNLKREDLKKRARLILTRKKFKKVKEIKFAI